ncbi:hypothetical protein SteCoe_34269 [Stentor coeruleus]|uniref:Methyltransferase domain-containing protein n=1 Tax=Stentor coeruleus TaxID=5963 RepID=A0A1R2AUY0_9CILI|nr:hypothetical protein SteCoe_34269 [Stentor coeruleus]
MSDWKTFSTYKEETIRQNLEKLKLLGRTLTLNDFSSIDLFHPGMHAGLDMLMSEYSLPKDGIALDIGCGIGGVSRYLASCGFTVKGVDINDSFLKIAQEITELVGLSDKITYHSLNLVNDEIPPASYTFANMICVLILISDISFFRDLYKYFQIDGAIYIEDYFLIRECITDEERKYVNDLGLTNIRTLESVVSTLQSYGYEVKVLEDISKIWSESIWDRAERIWNRKIADEIVDDLELYGYAIAAPKMLSFLSHYSIEELSNLFPHTLNAVGIKTVYENEKFVNCSRIAAFKRS